MGRKIPITPEQEALPISKYYHREPAPIPAEKLALLAKGPAIPAARWTSTTATTCFCPATCR